MSVKDGPSCPGCGLPNYEGLCPHCRGDQDAYEQELVPPFPTTRSAEGEQIGDPSFRRPEVGSESGVSTGGVEMTMRPRSAVKGPIIDPDADWRQQRPRRTEALIEASRVPCPVVTRKYGLRTVCGADNSGYYVGHAGPHRGQH